MKKLLCLLSVMLLGMGQMNAETQKVHANLADATTMDYSSWDAETQTLSWTISYANALHNLGLPTGDLSVFEKVAVECADLNAVSFRILVYVNGEATTITVNQTGLQEFKLSDYLSENALKNITEVTLSGGNEDESGSGSVRILDFYLETFDDAVIQKQPSRLSFSKAMVLLKPGEPFVAPELVNPHNVPVEWSATSEPTGSVSIDAQTGAVTLADGELYATVKASFAGNTLYEAGQASYLIRVWNPVKPEGLPLHYDVENTAAGQPDPDFPTIEEMQANPEKYYCEPLTDPFEFSDGSGRALTFDQWQRRRGEIARELQHYELGEKPAVPMDDIDAWMDGNTLFVKVTVGDQSLTLNTTINYPAGGMAPYPLMIGADNISIPQQLITSRNIARLNLPASQVNGYSQMGGNSSREFRRLYPQYSDNGAYIEWAWGLSRILDGLQKLGPEQTKIDMDHIGVTGCSYAGKMALMTGAFDERVCLIIPQEPGGGGVNAWRVSRVWNRDFYNSKDDDAVEGLDNTDYSWFMKSLKENFAKDNTFYLPYDHHELAAMACPRAILLLGNPSQRWLGDFSGYVSINAARKVYERYGIADRCGYSMNADHSHCQLPQAQYADVERFLDRFLLGKDVDTNITLAPMFSDPESTHKAVQGGLVELGQWMDWWESEDHKPNTLEDNRPEAVTIWGDASTMVPEGCTDWVREADETSPTKLMAHAVIEEANKTVPEDKARALQFTFTSPAKQKYYIYAYVNCEKSNADAVFLAFDDNEAYASNGASTKGEWAWKNLTALIAKADQTKFVSNLDQGEHTLYIWAKELNYKVALVCVTNIETLDEFKTAVKNVDLGTVASGVVSLMRGDDVVSSQYFTVDGRQLAQPQKGLNVVRQTLRDGQQRTVKVVF